MIFNCPHCQTEFQAPAQPAGAQVVCPTCGASFKDSGRTVNREITCCNCGRKLAESERANIVRGQVLCCECEKASAQPQHQIDATAASLPATAPTCKGCGRPIPKPEKFYLMRGAVVCKQCRANLRRGKKDRNTQILKLKLKWAKEAQAQEYGTWNTVAFVLGVLSLLFALVGTLRNPMFSSDVDRFASRGGLTLFGTIALSLILRSFLPRLTIERLVSVTLGGILAGIALAPCVALWGFPKKPGFYSAMVIFLAPACLLLIYGFTRRK